MTSASRVVWSEGMFLRTQHLQQQDRWVEALMHTSTQWARHHAWGFQAIELDQGLLAQSKIAIRRASGIMPDGSAFTFPDDCPNPEPVEIAAATGQTIIYLALPLRVEGSAEIDVLEKEPTGARYMTHEVDIRDSLAHADGVAPIHVAKMRFQLLSGPAPRDAYAYLPVARVSAVMTDGTLLLDNEFPVPCLTFGVSPFLTGIIDELVGKLESIARERAAFVAGRRPQGAGDLADFMALQLCNRYLAGARHLAAQRAGHPEDLYRWLLEFLGEASSFLTDDPVAPEIEPYRHAEPWLGFRPLITEVRRVLLELARPDRKAIPIPLRLFPSGARAADVQDRSLFTDAIFFLAVQGLATPEAIRQRLPGQITIGPAENLETLVRAAVPGIPLRHVPTVPREIPARRQMIYFELDRNNEFWLRLPQSGGLAINVNGDLREGMEMECWAVRN
jgi:type VI secretion system protein ImpJ